MGVVCSHLPIRLDQWRSCFYLLRLLSGRLWGLCRWLFACRVGFHVSSGTCFLLVYLLNDNTVIQLLVRNIAGLLILLLRHLASGDCCKVSLVHHTFSKVVAFANIMNRMDHCRRLVLCLQWTTIYPGQHDYFSCYLQQRELCP